MTGKNSINSLPSGYGTEKAHGEEPEITVDFDSDFQQEEVSTELESQSLKGVENTVCDLYTQVAS